MMRVIGRLIGSGRAGVLQGISRNWTLGKGLVACEAGGEGHDTLAASWMIRSDQPCALCVLASGSKLFGACGGAAGGLGSSAADEESAGGRRARGFA